MKTMKNAFGAVALPFTAPTSGMVQGTALSATGLRGRVSARGLSGFGGGTARLRARDLAPAPDSVLLGGPVI
ncbi:hypothetical protein [Cellulomonas triticagri]|uniref:Uncharacterized protein n=1 Tax=Cellulomonas triticagri TaxID=2483352 RepID=A0A3M2JLA1_9CELL|nr:hypothetical protein [Cellulomonas triticagri]RMI12996.1 hypothetical protein EBM89_06205 [Cellulomonas triticagri]